METPKEKAANLVRKFLLKIMIPSDYRSVDYYNAIECAKIEADSILKIIRYHGKDIGEEYSLKRWQEVTQELEKLL